MIVVISQSRTSSNVRQMGASSRRTHTYLSFPSLTLTSLPPASAQNQQFQHVDGRAGRPQHVVGESPEAHAGALVAETPRRTLYIYIYIYIYIHISPYYIYTYIYIFTRVCV